MHGLTAIRKVLEHCILAGRDLVLPSMADAAAPETFFIIACADAGGAEAMTRRLHGELDKPRFKPVITATTLHLSANDQPWEGRIAEVATRIDRLVQAHLLERESLK